ncbi:MAG: dioxygenase [Chloroflexi bacterium]|nr:MAG: dioxygenase [Chloroflexota bacterium]
MRRSMSAVRTGLVLMALVMLAACSSSSPTTAAPSATPTICHGGTTPERGEGPYHKSGSPERTSLLEPGVVGTPFSLTGHVLTRSCKPIAAAVLDFWQADGNGVYDTTGYRLQGHQSTDARGAYRLETVIPGEYWQHIHVMVRAPNGAILFTQLYLFPNSPRNQPNPLFDKSLEIKVSGSKGYFDFVLNED